MSTQRFQVDLGGLIGLLSEHLYSGPQVFVRELLQNAVDAISARQAADPNAPGFVRIWVEDDHGVPTLTIRDTGVGLTASDAEELLATIGSSSKRLEDFSDASFIGQFGIGLLAAFMVADKIEVTSQAVSGEPGISWIGHSHGEFELSQADDHPIGTSVRLRAKHGAEHWFDDHTIVGLARDYGMLLPFDVAVQVATPEGEKLWRRITEPAPWQVEYRSPRDRGEALSRYCEDTFGFTPLTHIDLNLPAASLTGVAFVLPLAVAPGASQHRVYVKNMLLGNRVGEVLPDWAFFVRAVVSTSALSPAASREQLRADEALLAVQEALGEQLKRWALDTLRSPSNVAMEFVKTHHLALRSLALQDQQMLELISEVLPFETTSGPRTLASLRADGELLYTSTLEAFRRVATVARSHGITVLNAGYVYDSDIMDKLSRTPGWQVRELTSDDLTQVLSLVSPERELRVSEAVARAKDTLEEVDCDVLLRKFEPTGVPALLLRDAEGEYRRDLAAERDVASDIWSDLLGAFDTPGSQRARTLVLNDNSENVQRLLSAANLEVFDAALRSMYVSAVMLSGEGLDAREMHLLNDSLAHLMGAALERPSQE